MQNEKNVEAKRYHVCIIQACVEKFKYSIQKHIHYFELLDFVIINNILNLLNFNNFNQLEYQSQKKSLLISNVKF